MNSELQTQSCQFERILLVIFLFTLPLLNPWVRGDGVGYYAYARAPLIEHNLDFTHDYQAANDSFREGRLDENGQPKAEFRTRTGHLDNHFTVGPAMLWSPFLLVAHGGVLFARALGSKIPADGFSAPYRYAMALGTGLYGFLALLLSFRLARKYVGPMWSFVATIAIWWASSLPVYMYFNPSWSHAHSAFMVALFLWYWDATREHRGLAQWLLLGAIAGLMLDVYYANLMVVSVLAVEAVRQYVHILRSGHASSPSFLELLTRHLLFGFVVIVVMIPTFVSRWIVYGRPFETGYVSIRDFLWHSPVFLCVLFSSNHGLLSWTPLLGLAILGLLFFTFRMPTVGIPFFTAMVAFYLFIAFYPDWAGISSYGNRFFVSLTPLFILGLAYLLERVTAQFSQLRVALGLSSAVLACFVLWNLGLIYQWGTHLIPARGAISFRQASYNQFCVVPGELASHLRSYFFRRSDLMRQIEQRDREQLKESAQP
ncbi:MAG: hypothetical protein ABSG77_10920 [Candidatus Acidiferrum sp.]